ncbi:MAG: hypothetical protein ACI4D6_02035, partial [Chordicoccus sp.]
QIVYSSLFVISCMGVSWYNVIIQPTARNAQRSGSGVLNSYNMTKTDVISCARPVQKARAGTQAKRKE